MKRLYLLLLLTLVLVSCGTDGSHFKIDGHLLNLNQGEFYVYSTDGMISGMDTIHVAAGRFTYEIPCEKEGTLVIVFPNFSEQVVFAKAGKTVDIKGDASRLKDMEVSGTDDNKLMSKFREQSLNASPVQIKHFVELFVGDHPESIVSSYLIYKFFINTQTPDYAGAVKLYKILYKAQPENGRLLLELKKLETIANTSPGKRIAKFSAKDIYGNTITQANISTGKAIIYVWASFEYESCNMQRVIQEQVTKSNGSLKAIGICLDTSLKNCQALLKTDNISIPQICDQQMFDGKLIKQLGLTSIPDNIILKDGKITNKNVTIQELRDLVR